MMTLSDFDWTFVRRHSLRPAICLVVAAIALLASFILQQKNYQSYVSLIASQEAVHEDYDALLKQRAIVDRYHRRYQQFHELGFIAEESRLDWVEDLRVSTMELALPGLNYSIEPQSAVASPASQNNDSEQIQIRVSSMQLEMSLMHEMDLLRLFDQLQTRAPGLIHVDRCTLTLSNSGTALRLEPALAASCALRVYSVITSDVDRGGI